MPRNNPDRTFSVALALVLVAAVWMTSGAVHAGKREKPEEYAYSEPELQLELMNYADRYAAVAAQAIDDVERLGPPPETRRAILGDLVYSAAAAFSIAADPEPQVALLDMVVLTTLGRMVFESYWRPRLGPAADPVIAALSRMERDVWTLAKSILDEEQQGELRERITAFHRDNPELSTFSHFRFVDFPSKRRSSSLRKKASGGIFASVRGITDQVEQTRFLVERAIYVSTRLPLLMGGFGDLWITRLLSNPGVEEIRKDAQILSLASDRLAAVTEQLPEQITAQRIETIEQVVREVSTLRYEAIEHAREAIAKEREQFLRQIAAGDEGLGILVTELRQTLSEANTLVASTDSLAQRFETGDPEDPAEPFDVEDYRRAIAEAGAVVQQLDGLVQSTHELLSSPGAEGVAPALIDAIDAAGQTGEELVDHGFLRAALLILLALVGWVGARLCYQWLAMRTLGGRRTLDQR